MPSRFTNPSESSNGSLRKIAVDPPGLGGQHPQHEVPSALINGVLPLGKRAQCDPARGVGRRRGDRIAVQFRVVNGRRLRQGQKIPRCVGSRRHFVNPWPGQAQPHAISGLLQMLVDAPEYPFQSLYIDQAIVPAHPPVASGVLASTTGSCSGSISDWPEFSVPETGRPPSGILCLRAAWRASGGTSSSTPTISMSDVPSRSASSAS